MAYVALCADPSTLESPRGEAAAALLKETTDGASQPSARDFKFTWNQRACFGRSLHRAVMEGNAEMVRVILDTGQCYVNERFVYESKYEGVSQPGSGEAIHLAAAHGHREIVKVLLECRARLEAKVTRGAVDHYDVLHAAVFGQGRGGSADMVKFLMDERATPTLNANKHTPLHAAFLLGRPDLITIIRHGALEQGNAVNMGEGDDALESKDMCTPLELGISSGKMSAEELARVAPLSPVSLHVFARVGTECIFPFLERCLAQGIKTDLLTKCLSFQDLTTVIRTNPTAAGALFDKLTSMPEEDHPAWHPLPTSVSFSPKGFWDTLRYLPLLNPSKSCLTFYMPEHTWKYDNVNFLAPAWHRDLVEHVHLKPGNLLWKSSGRRLVRDVDVRVCHIPNLACPEIFAALGGLSASQHDLEIFSSSVVNGLISHVWANGACRVDIMQGLVGFYCLLLIIVEQVGCLQSANDAGELERILLGGRGGHAFSQGLRSVDLNTDWGSDDWDPLPISMNLVGANGAVQLLLDLLLFLGYLRISSSAFEGCKDYLSSGYLIGVLHSLLQIGCLVEPNNVPLRVIVIFCCWGYLLRTCTAFQRIACELIPLTQCAYGLLPSSVLTLVFFLATFHALFNLRKAQSVSMLSDLFSDTFAMLFAGELPDNSDAPVTVVAFTYATVLVFSVFVLNIFIGVIIEQYHEKKRIVERTYQQVLCRHCLTFLLHARSLPTQLLSRRVAALLAATAGLTILTIQVVGLVHGATIFFGRLLLIVCLMCIKLCVYQDQSNPWITWQREKRYLWIVVPKKKKPQLPNELAEMHLNILELLQLMRGLKEDARRPSQAATVQHSTTEALAEYDRSSWAVGEVPSELRS